MSALPTAIFLKSAQAAQSLNVASGVALLGLRTGIISKLPANKLGTFLKNRIRFVGVSDDYLIYDESPEARLACIITRWAPHRASRLLFMTAKSPVQRAFGWMKFLPKCIRALVCSTPPASALPFARKCAMLPLSLMKRFKEGGALISFDVNYRANLWSEEESRETIKKILPLVDILFVSEESSRRMFQKQELCTR